MYLKSTCFFLLLLSSIVATAQQATSTTSHKKPGAGVVKTPPAATLNRPNPRRERCGFAAYMKKAEARGYNEAAFEATLHQMVERRLASNETAFTGTVTIPVIFHVIYRNGQALSPTTPNLPASQFQAQIAQLNADYANLSGSTYGVAADVRIRFCLALVDSTGKPLAEPGIERINGSTRGWQNTNNQDEGTVMDYFDGTIKPATIWDPYSYFNVWTAGIDASELLGYATFPSLSTLAGLDEGESDGTAGCVIAWQAIGSLTVPGQDEFYGSGRTLTHESGHFFGLRHIWGDDACGNDYCGDTPPQDDATIGCPAAGTTNGCVPSAPKMFENYMDYTDDACVTTFTAQQALRCQAAMDNSPRRLQLIGSRACQERAGNAIQFATASGYPIPELGNSGTCPNSKSYSFKLYVSSAATGNATVNFVSNSGTALLNRDFLISPSSVNYTANDNNPKTVTITILDDQEAEPMENIVLAYTITGNGVVAGPDKQQLLISIIDDDVAGIGINVDNPVKTVLNENFNASTNLPAGWTSVAFDDGSGGVPPNQWVVSSNGGAGTNGNAAHITRNITTKPNTYANAVTSDAYLFTPLLDARGVKDLSLSFKWRCNGEEGYDAGYVGYIPEGTAVSAENVIYFDNIFVGSSAIQNAIIGLPVNLTNTRFTLVFNWENDLSDGLNPPFTIDDILLTGSYFTIAGTSIADTAFSQFAGQNVLYYSKSGTPAVSSLIASINNPSADLGCVSAAVASAGNGRTALNTTSGSYFRTDKVISIVPENAASNVTYQATLYFNATELATAWTPTEIANLKILKVRPGVSLSGILNAGDVELVTPTFNNQSANNYYSYTGSFTGFSQFMLVSPGTIVPVRMLAFEASAKKSSILLNWKTAQENNNRGFSIERSTNGTQFTAIGWVNGKGNSNTETPYSFSDNFIQPNTIYYYRLRQKDADNREDLSAVRQAHINKDGISVTVSPVPARDIIQVYISGTEQSASINLLNAQGQLVKTLNKNAPGNSNYKLNVSDLSPGIYLLQVILPTQHITRKIVIE